MNLPEQECVGEWCPILSNLWRPSNEYVGQDNPVKVIPLGPEVFPRLMQIDEMAKTSGERLRKFFSS